jgi:hypothetical protein
MPEEFQFNQGGNVLAGQTVPQGLKPSSYGSYYSDKDLCPANTLGDRATHTAIPEGKTALDLLRGGK